MGGPSYFMLSSHAQLRTVGEALRRQFLRKTGSFTVTYDAPDAVGLAFPPLAPRGRLGGVHFREIVQAEFGRCTSSADDLIALWGRAAHTNFYSVASERRLRLWCARAFPLVPWDVPTLPEPRYRLVQVLTAISWQLGGFAGRSTAFPLRVRVPSGYLRLDAAGVEVPGIRRRLTPSITLGLDQLAAEPFSKRRPLTKRAGAVFRALTSVMPAQTRDISTVFSIAAHATDSQSAQEALISSFDVPIAEDRVEDLDKLAHARAWREAERLVDGALKVSCKEIADVLRPAISSKKVYSHFGWHPYRPRPLSSDERERVKLQLRDLEAKHQASFGAARSASPLSPLLALQDQLRRVPRV